MKLLEQSADAEQIQRQRFSIAMATFNGEAYIREQLNSLAGQLLLPYELIVCDDGSLDNTVSILQEFQKRRHLPLRYTGIPGGWDLQITSCKPQAGAMETGWRSVIRMTSGFPRSYYG